MAKGQQRSNREAKKPKANKKPVIVAGATTFGKSANPVGGAFKKKN
jgi:hypothetical protein